MVVFFDGLGNEGGHSMICNECETVAHCTKHGCVPKQPAPVQDASKQFHEWAVSEHAAQPAPEVTNLAAAIEYADARWSGVDVPIEWARHFADAIGKPYATPPAAEFVCSTRLCHYKALPDALTSADIQEHIEYVAGWNDYRKAMMEMMK
jgi:hypothetical protein